MSRFHRLVRLPREGRSPAVSDRALGLSFSGRFVDEVLSGAWSALSPTFRSHFGLSLVQVGLLDQVLSWVALAVEPPASLLIDVRSRRVLLAFRRHQRRPRHPSDGLGAVVRGAAGRLRRVRVGIGSARPHR